MKRVIVAVAVLSGLMLGACGRYSNLTPEANNEEMKDNPTVYGNVGEAAKQSLNKYETDPNAAENAAVAKAQLFGQSAKTQGGAGATTMVIDTAAALKSTAE